MRFLCAHRGLNVCVRPEIHDTVYDRGNPRQIVKSRALILRFTAGGLTDQEFEMACKAWKRPHGVPSDANQRMHFSTLDTDLLENLYGWDEATKKEVEDYIIGLNAPDILLVSEDPPARPWATYDEMEDPDKLAFIAKETGVVDQAVAYEKANLNRPTVLEALGQVETVAQ